MRKIIVSVRGFNDVKGATANKQSTNEKKLNLANKPNVRETANGFTNREPQSECPLYDYAQMLPNNEKPKVDKISETELKDFCDAIFRPIGHNETCWQNGGLYTRNPICVNDIIKFEMYAYAPIYIYVDNDECYQVKLSKDETSFSSLIGTVTYEELERLFKETDNPLSNIHKVSVIANMAFNSDLWFDVFCNLPSAPNNKSKEPVPPKDMFYYELCFANPNISLLFSCHEKLFNNAEIIEYAFSNIIGKTVEFHRFMSKDNVLFAQGILEKEFVRKTK
jgi:hypothetical protein